MRTRRAGFTLAEVAITLLIVSITLTLVIQGLNSSKAIAAQANHRKVAMELALLTLGRVEAGLFWEELDGLPGTFEGSYAEEGYEAFYWELVVGDEDFYQADEEQRDSPYFDNYEYRRYQAEEYDDEPDETLAFAETGSTGGPFERVAVRVTYPKLTEQENQLTVERWIPLKQVFGRSEEQIAADELAAEEEEDEE